MLSERVCDVVPAAVVPERLGMGFGRAKTPQFVKPRITPLLERTSLPAVLAMLLGVCVRGVVEWWDGGGGYSFTSAILFGRTWKSN